MVQKSRLEFCKWFSTSLNSEWQIPMPLCSIESITNFHRISCGINVSETILKAGFLRFFSWRQKRRTMAKTDSRFAWKAGTRTWSWYWQCNASDSKHIHFTGRYYWSCFRLSAQGYSRRSLNKCCLFSRLVNILLQQTQLSDFGWNLQHVNCFRDTLIANWYRFKSLAKIAVAEVAN